MANTNQDINVNVKLSKDDFIEMNLTYLKAGRGKSKVTSKVSFVFAVIILILLMLIGITSFLSGGSFSEASIIGIRLVALVPAFILAAVFLILYAFYHYGFPAIIKRYWNKHFDDNNLQKETRYVISPEGIRIFSEAEPKTWRFHEIYKIQETRKHLFIYETEDSANIIPKHCFDRKEEITAAVSIFKEKLPPNKYEAY